MLNQNARLPARQAKITRLDSWRQPLVDPLRLDRIEASARRENQNVNAKCDLILKISNMTDMKNMGDEKNEKKIHDLAILGAGPAGLSASVYASRYAIGNVVIGGVSGGLMTQSPDIGNWLGTQQIPGYELSQKSVEHAKSLGGEIIPVMVDEIKNNGEVFSLLLSDGRKLDARAILLALGTKHRHLNVPGEKEFAGKGVSYCATCDGFFYRGKTVIVVGGSDSAACSAVHLAGIAEKVYVLYRGEALRCEASWKMLIEKNPKIEVLTNTNIKEIRGGEKVEKVIIDSIFEGKNEISVDGVFVEAGSDPNNILARELGVDCDEGGYIVVGPDMRTNIKGIWAAGDITTGSNKFKQIVTAAAEGAIAANSIQKYLNK